jgi:hypothetical protein
VDGVGGGGGDLVRQREGVNARGFRQGSQCEGVQAWLAPRRLLSSGGKVLGEEEKAAKNMYIKVEITCRGRQLLPILTLQHVRDISNCMNIFYSSINCLNSRRN